MYLCFEHPIYEHRVAYCQCIYCWVHSAQCGNVFEAYTHGTLPAACSVCNEAAEQTDVPVEEDVRITNASQEEDFENEFDEIFFATENDFTAEVVSTDTLTASDIRLQTPETDRFLLEKAGEFQDRQTPTGRKERRKYLTDVEAGQLSDNSVDMDGPEEDEGHLAYYNKQTYVAVVECDEARTSLFTSRDGCFHVSDRLL